MQAVVLLAAVLQAGAHQLEPPGGGPCAAVALLRAAGFPWGGMIHKSPPTVTTPDVTTPALRYSSPFFCYGCRLHMGWHDSQDDWQAVGHHAGGALHSALPPHPGKGALRVFC